MSHIVTIKTEIRDAVALATACQRLALAPPRHGSFRLFTSTATGRHSFAHYLNFCFPTSIEDSAARSALARGRTRLRPVKNRKDAKRETDLVGKQRLGLGGGQVRVR